MTSITDTNILLDLSKQIHFYKAGINNNKLIIKTNIYSMSFL